MARRARPWYWRERDLWCAVIGGVRETLAEGKANKAEAERRFHELMATRAANPRGDDRRQTIASVIESYLVHAERHLAPRNYENQAAVLQRFAEAHGFRDVAEARPLHLTQWLDANPQWASDWTVYRVVGTVKRPFAWAVGQELIGRNPFQGVTRKAGAPLRPITDGEFRAMLRGAGGRRGKTFRQALIFLRFTGCRPCEMARLRWSDIDLDARRIVMRRHKTTRQTKTPRPRVVPLVGPVAKLLIYRRRVSSASEHVFLNERGNPWHRSALALRVARCRDRQGIPADAKLYGVRHEFGTRAVVRGVDLKTLAQLMGHSSTRMTEHYLHLAGEAEHLETSMRRATARR